MSQNNTQINPFFDNAAKYYEIGLSVFPTRVDNGKRPAVSDWSKYCLKRPSPLEIETWENSRHAKKGLNITMACGIASGVVVLDWDLENEDLSQLAKALLPPSLFEKVGKPGRWSRLYRYSSELSRYVCSKYKPAADKGPCWELLSSGRHSVLPPSFHPDGGNYVWTCEDFDNGLEGLGELKMDDLTRLDEAINQFYLGKNKGSYRHNRLITYMFSRIEKINSMEEAINEFINIDKQWFGDNSYFEDKAEKGTRTPREFCEYLIKSVGRTIEQKRVEKNISENEIGAERFFIQKVNEKTGQVNWVPNYRALGDYFKNKGDLVTSASGDYVYKDGFWKYIDSDTLKSEIRDLTNPLCNDPKKVDLFLKDVRAACNESSFQFESIENKFNFENGIFDLNANELLEHSNKFFFTSKSPYKYTSNAKCPKWLSFLDEVFEGDYIQIDNLQKAFGDVILGGKPRYEKAFFLIGDGRNGKGVVLNVLKAIVGEDNYSSVSLKDMTEKFSAIMLKGKILNISEELSKLKMESDIFKKAVSGEEIIGSYKGKDNVKFKCTARLFFASNHPPVFNESSPKFMDRIHVFNFNKYVPEEKRDMYLTDKLLLELPGIFNWALVGAHKVIAKVPFVSTEQADETKEEMSRLLNPVYDWFCECIEISVAGKTLSSNLLFEEFFAFVHAGNFNPHIDRRWAMRHFSQYYKDACRKENLEIKEENKTRIGNKTIRTYPYVVIKKSYLNDSKNDGFNSPFGPFN